jgi:putative MATE family efflux protein
MTPQAKNRADLPLARLAVPMYLENLLRSALTSADVVMLSFYSQTAVAAVGLVNSFSFFILIMYTVVTAGSSVIISQLLGAGRDAEAGEAALASFVLATVFALAVSLGMALGAGAILSIYDVEPEVRLYAWQYLTITAGCSIFVAFNVAQATVLRAYGHAKEAMWSNMTSNILNVIGNSIAIFGPFGIPKTGVAGVAVSTVVSQAAACLILASRIRKLKEISIPWRRFASISPAIYRKAIGLGAPIAGENLAYNLAQIVNGWIIAGFGTAALSANTYALTLLRFVFMPSFSIGNAAQIKTGYLVGAGRADQAKRDVWKYFGIGAALSMAMMAALYAARIPLMSIFTKDPVIVAMVSSLFLISFAREAGRTSNIVIIPGLKGSGDVFFPVIIGIVFMWGIGVAGSWLLGIRLGLGLPGVWIALTADEWIRGILMGVRWQSGVWRGKALVKAAAAAPGSA